MSCMPENEFRNGLLEKFGSGPRRSLRRSAERPARAAWAALRLLAAVAIGATMELGRSWRTLLLMLLLRPRGAGEPRGHRQQAALKEQRFRERLGNWPDRSLVTKAALGGRAIQLAVTRVKFEQASKESMQTPTRLLLGEGRATDLVVENVEAESRLRSSWTPIHTTSDITPALRQLESVG